MRSCCSSSSWPKTRTWPCARLVRAQEQRRGSGVVVVLVVFLGPGRDGVEARAPVPAHEHHGGAGRDWVLIHVRAHGSVYDLVALAVGVQGGGLVAVRHRVVECVLIRAFGVAHELSRGLGRVRVLRRRAGRLGGLLRPRGQRRPRGEVQGPEVDRAHIHAQAVEGVAGVVEPLHLLEPARAAPPAHVHRPAPPVAELRAHTNACRPGIRIPAGGQGAGFVLGRGIVVHAEVHVRSRLRVPARVRDDIHQAGH